MGGLKPALRCPRRRPRCWWRARSMDVTPRSKRRRAESEDPTRIVEGTLTARSSDVGARSPEATATVLCPNAHDPGGDAYSGPTLRSGSGDREGHLHGSYAWGRGTIAVAPGTLRVQSPNPARGTSHRGVGVTGPWAYGPGPWRQGRRTLGVRSRTVAV